MDSVILHDHLDAAERSELPTLKALLLQALVHMMKAEAWPLSSLAPDWRARAREFRVQARRRFMPSMRQQIDVRELYAGALGELPDAIDGEPPFPLPFECSVTLDELMSNEWSGLG